MQAHPFFCSSGTSNADAAETGSAADDLISAATDALRAAPLTPDATPLLAAAALALVATKNFSEAAAVGRVTSAAAASPSLAGNNGGVLLWATEFEMQLEATALYALLEEGKASDVSNGYKRVFKCLRAAAKCLPAKSSRRVALFQGLLFGQWIPVAELWRVSEAAKELLPEGAMRIAVLTRLLAVAEEQEALEQPRTTGVSQGECPPVCERIEGDLVSAVGAVGPRTFLNVVGGCVLKEAAIRRVLAACTTWS